MRCGSVSPASSRIPACSASGYRSSRNSTSTRFASSAARQLVALALAAGATWGAGRLFRVTVT